MIPQVFCLHRFSDTGRSFCDCVCAPAAVRNQKSQFMSNMGSASATMSFLKVTMP